MESIIKKLVEAASLLDASNKTDIADSIDKISNSILDIKTSQYVGAQGYWIRNSRCFANCWRQKRTKTPTKAAQEIWNECHKEYVESINNDGSSWDKYAEQQSNNLIKKAEHYEYPAFEEYFNNLKKGGTDTGTAIFASIDFASSKDADRMIDYANALTKMASKTISINPDVAILLSQAADGLLKESQAMSNLWRRFRNKGRDFSGYNPYSLDAKKLKVMINDLTTTLDNYSEQRKFILQHLDLISKHGGPSASDAQQVSQLLKGGPLTRDVLRQINTIMSDMIGKEQGYDSDNTANPAVSGAAEEPVAEQTANDTAVTQNVTNVPEVNGDTRNRMVEDFSSGGNLALRTFFDKAKSDPRLVNILLEKFKGNPAKYEQIRSKLLGENKSLNPEHVAKSFNLMNKKAQYGKSYKNQFERDLEENPEDFINALVETNFGGDLNSMFNEVMKQPSSASPANYYPPAPKGDNSFSFLPGENKGFDSGNQSYFNLTGDNIKDNMNIVHDIPEDPTRPFSGVMKNTPNLDTPLPTPSKSPIAPKSKPAAKSKPVSKIEGPVGSTPATGEIPATGDSPATANIPASGTGQPVPGAAQPAKTPQQSRKSIEV